MCFKLYTFFALVTIGFGVHLAHDVIVIVAGPQWDTPETVLSLQIYCVLIPMLGFNGITEALAHSVATKSQLAWMSIWYAIVGGLYWTIGFYLLKIQGLGTPGLLVANIVIMLVRVIFSIAIARSHIPEMKLFIPRLSSWIAFAVSTSVLAYLVRSALLTSPFQRVLFGGCLGFTTLLVLYRTEHSFIAAMMNIKSQ
jgi:hypothetical protein